MDCSVDSDGICAGWDITIDPEYGDRIHENIAVGNFHFPHSFIFGLPAAYKIRILDSGDEFLSEYPKFRAAVSGNAVSRSPGTMSAESPRRYPRWDQY